MYNNVMNSRILPLNNQAVSETGQCVICVMSRDQRVQDNHALLRAQQIAIDKKLPLVVVFNVLSKSGDRSQEHYQFMLAGLRQVEQELSKLSIEFVLFFEDHASQLLEKLNELNPAALVFDFSPLKGPRLIKDYIAKNATCSVEVIDTHNIIPTWVASEHEEFAAHTFRRKVHLQLMSWLEEPAKLQKHSFKLKSALSPNWALADKIAQNIKPNGTHISQISGSAAGLDHLEDFKKNHLASYASDRNVPTLDGLSGLSPYLHYGQISSLRVALELTRDHTPLLIKEPRLAKYEGEPTLGDSIDALLEELIVRKELADNYCYYNPSYKTLEGAKDWAKKTLAEHQDDKREYIYSLAQLEDYKTHDPAWNAAQAQMRKTGKMHGYMRMYWAKKILEWSPSPELAVKHANYLNDHYSIDGGDPNGYVGVLWSIAGLHDRAWFGRPVFGKIRYMNYNGLKNRFDVEAYIKKWLP